MLIFDFRKYDQPSFTLQAFIPSQARDAYLALRALNIDISMIADTTSHPTIGAMRMQFWRDAITSCLAGSPRKEPTAILLASAVEDLDTRSKGRVRFS
jgi:NADH dehydrogenase [ubiquinone] 1 alpha subcomplex assembly factor 6